MANTALKTSLKTELVEMIKQGISDSNAYHLFVSRATPYDDNTNTTTTESDANPPSIGESARNVYDTFRNILFIKRIQPENIRLVIPRVDWVSDDVYTAYSETTDMAGKNYYVMTTEYNVYKCLTSNGASRIMPTGKSPNAVTFGDGYQWKYIYTVPEDYLGFITLEYIPVFVANDAYPNQQLVQSTSKPGSLETISFNRSYSPIFPKIFKLERQLSTTSLFTDTGKTANVRGSTYISFNPSGENDAPGNSYWNGYGIYITQGAGIGQYFRILNFYKGGNAGGSYYYANVYPEISRDLSVDTSRMKVVPYMVVHGNGSDALVVPATSMEQKITGLNILKPGVNYSYIKPMIVTESDNQNFSSQIAAFNNSISVGLSTPKGHGANAINEFGTSDMMIAMEIDGNEGGKISTRNEYRQFGILKNPLLYGGYTLAGSEQTIAMKALVKKQPSKDEQYIINTFVAGNYIIGKESRASARILDSERIPGSRFHRLYLTDIAGKFKFADDSSLKTRIYHGNSFAGTFVTGDTAFQYQNIIGQTLSSTGIILSFNTQDKSLLLNTTYGSFTANKTIVTLLGTTLNSTDILDVDEDFGEQIGQMSIGLTRGSQFLSFGSDEVFGRLASTAFIPTKIEDAGEYRLTTKLVIVGASVYADATINGSAAEDGVISQTNSVSMKKSTGNIVDFTVAGGSGYTGNLYLSNLTGTFNTTDALIFTPYGSTADTTLTTTTINSIENPEITIGSGELLYIENVRPIERNIEQSEEFKIVIGF
jgi:hypothetical protein